MGAQTKLLLMSIFALTLFLQPSYCQKNIDSIFVEWNKASLNSLEKQKHATADSSHRKIVENRILAFKNLFEIKFNTDINTNSIRYLFLKKLLSDPTRPIIDCIIFEGRSSGTTIQIKNFVIVQDTTQSFRIDVYSYQYGKWVKEGHCENISLDFHIPLDKYHIAYPNGFNQEDIIVSKLTKDFQLTSEYFLFLTLDPSLANVLNCYTKTNFIRN